MRMVKYVLLFLILVGCNRDPFREELKCIDGQVYIKNGGIWVQALLYKENKCQESSK